jgi:hypothetical protein
MDPQITLRQWPAAACSPSRFVRSMTGAALLLALAAAVLGWCWPVADRAAATRSTPSLVHWQDAAHDWLLVVDPATRELVVYDAVDGRPLQRLGADDGLPEVQSIARHGSWLQVTGKQHPPVRLKLPQLQAVAARGR